MKISVVTASYNYQDYIKETIQSVLDQTYKDWELIIVDDCSTDNSVEVIKSYKDDRIKLFVNEKNLGLKETVRRGIEKATGEWIVFLESDDILTSDNIEKKVEIVKKYPEVNLVFNDCEFFGDEERVKKVENDLRKTRKILRRKKYPTKMFYNFYLSNKIFTFSSVMVKRDDLLKVNFETPIDVLLDWWLWIQLSNLGKFYYISEYLTKWRLHKASYVSQSTYSSPKQFQMKMYMEIFKKQKNLYILLFVLFEQLIWNLQKHQRRIKRLIFNKTK